MAPLVQELGKFIFQVQCKVHQQMIRKSGNLQRTIKSEKVIFEMVTERIYAIWWLNMFREWILKSKENNNWKSTSPSMRLNPGNRQQVKTRWTELSGLSIEGATHAPAADTKSKAAVNVHFQVGLSWKKYFLIKKLNGNLISGLNLFARSKHWTGVNS